MIAIIDYGMGNLRSVQKALEKVGAQTLITQNSADIKRAEKIVLPGVGAMQPAMQKLQELKLIDAIKEAISQGKPFLGICLGLQLLFEKSFEGGDVPGLGIFSGTVERFSCTRGTSIKVPHMGWNQIKIKNPRAALFSAVHDAGNFYFCHSYFVNPKDPTVIVATTGYGIEFASAVWRENVFGVQFHPEKSQSLGLEVLRNFSEYKQTAKINPRSVSL